MTGRLILVGPKDEGLEPPIPDDTLYDDTVYEAYGEADLQPLPFADATFDRGVVSSALLELPGAWHWLGELRRVVSPSGEIEIRLVDGASQDSVPGQASAAARSVIVTPAPGDPTSALLTAERAARAAAELKAAEADQIMTWYRVELARLRDQVALARWRTSVAEGRKLVRIAERIRRAPKPWRLPSALVAAARIAMGPAVHLPRPVPGAAATVGTRSQEPVAARWMPQFDPAVFPPPQPRRPELRVVAILDEFSQLAFQYEFSIVPLPRHGWRETIDRERPAFLFVESAWNGNRGEWKYAFTGETAPKPDVVDLVAYCRKRRIPTVYWNKEDPLEYDLFLRTARHFDWVFTVDENCVDRYRRDLRHDRVGVLPFAVQPRIHNPIGGSGDRPEDVAFAGTYYSGKYPERQRQMDDLLKPVVDLGLHIYSRFESDPKYQFPGGLRECVVGSLDYARMLAAYRQYKVFLNVNSVVDSPTMFSRRVLELLACGTPVVSGPSPGMQAMLGPGVVAESADPETTRMQVRALLASPELRDRRAVVGLRAVMNGNTYADRVDAVAAALGLPAAPRSRRISVVAPTNRPGGFRQVLASVGAQTHPDIEMIIGLHGIDEDEDEIRAEARSRGVGDLQVIRLPSQLSLGRVLNHLVRAAHGDYIAKMDDDDFYGPHYLADQVLAFDYSDADIVGKWSRFILMEEVPCLGVLFPGKEHCYTELVAGGTLLFRREVFDAVQFGDRAVGEDTHFLRDCAARGLRTYSTDRFNYVYRRTSRTDHTHRPHELRHLANTRIVSFGTSVDHAFV